MDYEKLIEQLKQKDGLWCSVPTGEKLVTDAADALTALLAENEKRQDELEQARAEITRLKHYEDKCHDCPIVCAKTEIIKAHEELEAVQAELEQKSKLIAQQVAELERRDKLLKEQETELDQMKRERDAAIDCIYKIEDALDRGNDNDWAREHISEWESQKED
jgi:cell division septum initiation protein DivIVA